MRKRCSGGKRSISMGGEFERSSLSSAGKKSFDVIGTGRNCIYVKSCRYNIKVI